MSLREIRHDAMRAQRWAGLLCDGPARRTDLCRLRTLPENAWRSPAGELGPTSGRLSQEDKMSVNRDRVLRPSACSTVQHYAVTVGKTGWETLEIITFRPSRWLPQLPTIINTSRTF